MRFTRTELSPANKKQYVMAMGKKDIELLLETAHLAHKYMPNTKELKDSKRRLASIGQAFAAAMKEAENDSDEGDKLPLEERQKYKNALAENPMAEINRLELIDHRPCNKCHGEMFYNELQKDGSYKPTECSECHGMGSAGRQVIFWNDRDQVTSSVQDQGRTLKLFVSRKEP